MSGYLADWLDAERRQREVMERFPDCTMRSGCPATEHPVDFGMAL